MFQHSLTQKTWTHPLNLRDCILLDNESTIHSFCNEKMVKEVTNCPHGVGMTLSTNGGTITTNKQCKLDNLDQEVWFNKKFITNVLSLAMLKNKYRITYDSNKDGAFVVHRPNKTNLIFRQHPAGLHLLDMSKGEGPTEISLVETVVDRESTFTKRQTQDAKAARVLQMTIGFPTDQDFKTMVTTGLLKNCPITSENIEVANAIYGPSVAGLKGRTTRSKPMRLKHNLIPVPPSITEDQKKVTICADVMYVNRLPFLVTIAVNLGFTTIEALTGVDTATLLSWPTNTSPKSKEESGSSKKGCERYVIHYQ